MAINQSISTKEETLSELTSNLETNSSTFRNNKKILSYSTRGTGLSVYDKTCPLCGQNYLVNTEGTILSSSNISDETEINDSSNISANRIITTPERMFISYSQLLNLESINNSYMKASDYTGNGTKLINRSILANEALSIKWENIEDKPNIDYSSIETTISNSHNHSNYNILNYLGIDSNNEPTWNNESWPYPTESKSLDLYEPHIRNVIVYDGSTPIVNKGDLNKGDILIEVDNNENYITSISIKYNNRNGFYSLKVEDIITTIIDQLESPVSNIVEQNMITDHEDMSNIQGGIDNEHYHLTLEEYKVLQRMILQYQSTQISYEDKGFPITIVR